MLEILFILTLVSSGSDHFREFFGIMPDDSITSGAQFAGCWDDGFCPPPEGQGLDNRVYSIATNGSEIWVGGLFNQAGDVFSKAIAKWDGSSWSGLGSGLVGGAYEPEVWAVAVSGTDVYVGGYFWTSGGAYAMNIARWNGSSWFSLCEGVSSTVYAIATSGVDVYAGGAFYSAGEVPGTSRIARWDGYSWNALGSGMNSTVRAIAVSGSDVYAGGYFTEAGGVPANFIARWDGGSWSALGSGMNSHVWAIAVSGSDVYAGGNFTEAGGVAANYIARWDGFSWSPLGDGLNNIVTSITVYGNELYVGGFFTQAGGVDANHIARWDGSSWTPLGSGLNDNVQAVAMSGSDVFAGGNFTHAGGYPSSYLARWIDWGQGVAGSPADSLRILSVIPNPMMTNAVVSFLSPDLTSVALSVFDISGRLVGSQELGAFPEGQNTFSWSDTGLWGSSLSPGIYLIRLSGDGCSASHRIVILR